MNYLNRSYIKGIKRLRGYLIKAWSCLFQASFMYKWSCLFPLAAGNLRHLIVEACIERNLLDTSAYSWPGYANACSNQIPYSISNHEVGWSSLMKGSQLTPALVNILVATPASRYANDSSFQCYVPPSHLFKMV